ncbi:unnamed protein product [Gongylonema pulchrum]|uniref:GPI alpha-1,4-mannosyltransferase I, catalytic subunit n=1 Tax=Gongylonema pulchrum TaxID=637853 RepID=A0A183EYR6_9BILA|nr:unnamed protein product [Gongylonema pulchrum]
MCLICMWLLAQAIWLSLAYMFEFKGENTYFRLWLASLFFLVVNAVIIVQLIQHHVSALETDQKKEI